MFEGNKGTNIAIAETAKNKDKAKDFIHFNNGISIICDTATWQPFTSKLVLERPQVVNGGQTMRILNQCSLEGKLSQDVYAVVRVITTGKDKDFASNVAVNLNNQTRVDNTFLRSNDPRVVQLLHSLGSLGYFLERRSGEVDAMLPEEISELESRYGSPLRDHIIPFKDGMQAYVATYFEDPQTAKKDPSKIFTDDDGCFSEVLQSNLTAEKFRDSYELSKIVNEQVEFFKSLKRKRYHSEEERKAIYKKGIGDFIEGVFKDLDEAIPQITIFALAILFQKNKTVTGNDLFSYVNILKEEKRKVWESFIELINAKNNLENDKSWPTVLKSGTFYRDAVKYLKEQWQTE